LNGVCRAQRASSNVARSGGAVRSRTIRPVARGTLSGLIGIFAFARKSRGVEARNDEFMSANLRLRGNSGRLRGLFGPFGAVTLARCRFKVAEGQSRGSPGVEMPNEGEAKAAIAA